MGAPHAGHPPDTLQVTFYPHVTHRLRILLHKRRSARRMKAKAEWAAHHAIRKPNEA